MFLGKIDVLIAGINDFNMRRWFLAQWTLLYISHIEQENNVDDDFINDVLIFLLSNFLSTFDTSFPGVSTMIIDNNF